MITAGLLLLLLERVPSGVSAVGLTAIVVMLILAGIAWNRSADRSSSSPIER